MNSSWIDDLSVNPNGKYKFGSVSIRVKPHTIMITRQSYGLLDWLGDIGGLIDALSYLFSIILMPFL